MFDALKMRDLLKTAKFYVIRIPNHSNNDCEDNDSYTDFTVYEDCLGFKDVKSTLLWMCRHNIMMEKDRLILEEKERKELARLKEKYEK